MKSRCCSWCHTFDHKSKKVPLDGVWDTFDKTDDKKCAKLRFWHDVWNTCWWFLYSFCDLETHFLNFLLTFQPFPICFEILQEMKRVREKHVYFQQIGCPIHRNPTCLWAKTCKTWQLVFKRSFERTLYLVMMRENWLKVYELLLMLTRSQLLKTSAILIRLMIMG